MPPVPRRRSSFLIPTFHSLCSRRREKNGSAQSLLSWRLQAGEEVSHPSSYSYLPAPHPPSIPCAGMLRLGLCKPHFCLAWPSPGLCQWGATERIWRRRGDLLPPVHWQLQCTLPSTAPPPQGWCLLVTTAESRLHFFQWMQTQLHHIPLKNTSRQCASSEVRDPAPQGPFSELRVTSQVSVPWGVSSKRLNFNNSNIFPLFANPGGGSISLQLVPPR